MAKNSRIDVRLHDQEREWLLNLGGGNIVDGVRNLVRQMTGKDKWESYPKDFDSKSSNWGRKW